MGTRRKQESLTLPAFSLICVNPSQSVDHTSGSGPRVNDDVPLLLAVWLASLRPSRAFALLPTTQTTPRQDKDFIAKARGLPQRLATFYGGASQTNPILMNQSHGPDIPPFPSCPSRAFGPCPAPP